MKNKLLTKGLALALAISSVGIGSVSYANEEVDTNPIIKEDVDSTSSADKEIDDDVVKKQAELNNLIGQVKGFSERRRLRKAVRETNNLKELESIENEVNTLINGKEDKNEDKDKTLTNEKEKLDTETDNKESKESKENKDNKEQDKEKSFKDLKQKTINDILSKTDAFIPEAQKDGIKRILKTNNEEELNKALANFNPQGPVEEYPTTAKEYALSPSNKGYKLTINGNEFDADAAGNIALDRNYTKEIPKEDLADSELNAFITKYVVNQSNLSLVNQAIVENQIEEFIEEKKNGSLDVLEVIEKHRRLNATLLENKDFKYRNAINEDSEVLASLAKDIEAGKVSTKDKNGESKPTQDESHIDNKDSDKKTSKQPEGGIKDIKPTSPTRAAGDNAATGIAGLTGVTGVLVSAIIAYQETKRK